MADKEIKLKLAATGGDQAAAEVVKPTEAVKAQTEAVKELTAAEKDYQERKAAFDARRASGAFDKPAAEGGGDSGFGGMLEHGEAVRQAREKANEERLAQIEAEKTAVADLAAADKKALDAELDGMKEKEKAAKEYAEKLDDEAADRKAAGRKKEIAVAMGAIGIAAGLAVKTLDEVWEQLDKIDTADLKGVDAAFAEQIENAKKYKQALQDPIGALAALVNGGTTVKEAFAGMNEQLKLNAEASQEQIDRLIKKAGVNVGEIKKLAADLKTASDLLAAKDELARVEREGKDAEAIRNGADPDDVAAATAKEEAKRKIAEIERRQNQVRADEDPQRYFDSANASRALAEKTKLEQERRVAEAEAELQRRVKEGKEINPLTDPGAAAEALEKARIARAERDAATSDKGPAELIRRAQEQAKESQKAFEAAQKKIKEEDDKAAVEKQIIRAGLNNTVAGAAAKKSERQEKEQDGREDAGFEARKNFEEYQKWLADQRASGAKKNQSDAERRKAAERNADTEGPSIGQDAAEAAGALGARNGIVSGLTKLGLAIGKKGNGQQDAASLGIMLKMIDTLIQYAEQNGAGLDDNTQQLREYAKRVANLEGQLRRGRDMR